MIGSLKVFYSPQPDENPETSAAYEYSKRALDLLNQDSTSIDRLSLDSLDFLSEEKTETAADTIEETISSSSPPCTFILIIISCGADGSVDRNVRKLLRSMKTKTKAAAEKYESKQENKNLQSSLSSESAMVVAIALLGHARCDNSANQMKDTIFNYGRRFHKNMEILSTSSVFSKLEVQVELEGPDEPGGFDEWVNVNKVV